MTITVRVDKEFEHTLEVLAAQEGISKSALIRQCLEAFVERKQGEQSPWELGKNIFGVYGSGKGGLSTDRKNIIRKKIHAKRISD
ncbi:MAG: CopG family transcriptional regulator [SAR324 cluster bacterium]|nr:CopG family transcriptional regulator [SAR324 cluster bacterium]